MCTMISMQTAVSGSGNGKAGGTYESSYTSPKPVS